MLNDLRYALRTLGRRPGFAFAAIVSIGLAIGANAAIFSLADALFLRPLEVPDPLDVVTFATRPSTDDGRLSYPEYQDVRDGNRSFDSLVAVQVLRAGLARDANAQPELRIGFAATANFLETFGVVPRIGRSFRSEENEVPRRDAVVVLGEELWRRDFSGDPSVIGRRVRLNGMDFEVIGVAPDAFTGLFDLARPTFFVPLMMLPALEGAPDDSQLTDRGRRTLTVKGRLEPGVTREAASAEAAAIFAGLAERYPDTNRTMTAAVRTELQSRIDGNPYQPVMVAMLGVLTMVLLAIACGNVANLVLGRASARAREIGLRLAIGASRRRLLRQLMTENLVLAFVGGVVGIAFAGAGIFLLKTFAPSSGLDVPTPLTIRLDGRSVVLTFLIAAGSAIFFGMGPALRAGRTDLLSALKPGAAEGGRERMIWRSTLVVVQIAGSLVLIVAATQLARGMVYLMRQNPGFSTDHRITMRLDPSLAGYSSAQTEQFYRALIDRAAALPGVRTVGLTGILPMIPGFAAVALAPEGFALEPGQQGVTIASTSVDHRYFDALGIDVVSGRGFLASDAADAPWVAVVDQTFASRYLGSNPIGKRLRFVEMGGRTAEVVGVTGRSRHNSLFSPPDPFLYLPITQHAIARMTLVVHTDGDPAAMAAPLREVVRSIDVNVPVYRVETMEELYAQRTSAVANLLVGISTIVGLVGLCLALVGLYAIVSYQVSRRVREIGIRMALGAVRAQVLGMILRQAAVMGAVGIAVGTVISLAGSRGLTIALNAPAFDPLLFSAVPLVLFATTLLAALAPARRASTIDPQEALRQD
ncbi:MAG TPA: ABC transporter permease [Vicinamibacterales bacterium]|nr:ABC transporter permease [Vicinamibacterales bacterium]